MTFVLGRGIDYNDTPAIESIVQAMIAYGCAISDGDSHSHSDLPIVVAGGGGGTLSPRRHVDLRRDVPMSNLYLAKLDRMGVEADRFGDSTGRVKDL